MPASRPRLPDAQAVIIKQLSTNENPLPTLRRAISLLAQAKGKHKSLLWLPEAVQAVLNREYAHDLHPSSGPLPEVLLDFLVQVVRALPQLLPTEPEFVQLVLAALLDPRCWVYTNYKVPPQCTELWRDLIQAGDQVELMLPYSPIGGKWRPATVLGDEPCAAGPKGRLQLQCGGAQFWILRKHASIRQTSTADSTHVMRPTAECEVRAGGPRVTAALCSSTHLRLSRYYFAAFSLLHVT